MKDLFDRLKIITSHVNVPLATTKLDYEGFSITGDFNCSNTKIRSLEGAPTKILGHFVCKDTNITSLHNIHKQIKYIGGMVILSQKIKSHVMGVMLIKGVKKIGFAVSNNEQKQLAKIMNKHLEGDRDVHACQEELIEAGLGEFAKL